MTAITEQEAATKWCPLARVAAFGSEQGGGTAFNRSNYAPDAENAPCIAARCMAWRFGGDSQRVGELDGGRVIWRYHDRGVEQVYIGKDEVPEGFKLDTSIGYAVRPIPDGSRRGFCGAFEPRVSEVLVANVG